MWDAVSSATARSRPIINTKVTKALADSRCLPMHVIVGDTNVAEPTTALKSRHDPNLLIMPSGTDLQIEDLAWPIRCVPSVRSTRI